MNNLAVVPVKVFLSEKGFSKAMSSDLLALPNEKFRSKHFVSSFFRCADGAGNRINYDNYYFYPKISPRKHAT